MKAEDKLPYHEVLSERLAQSLGHLLTKHESERQHIAATLIDTIQSLLALQVQLFALTDELPVEPDERLHTTLVDSLSLIESMAVNLSIMARGLRPIELSTVGLNAALQEASEEFSRLTQVDVVYQGEEVVAVSEVAASAFYGFSKEVFDNIRKHAQATKVWVTLTADEGNVRLEIKDNGNGFLNGENIVEPLQAPGLGLFGLMTYMQQLNGRLIIQSQVGQGTTVTAVLPRSL